jgi:uncharacterized membrane protein (UPF0136 family)
MKKRLSISIIVNAALVFFISSLPNTSVQLLCFCFLGLIYGFWWAYKRIQDLMDGIIYATFLGVGSTIITSIYSNIASQFSGFDAIFLTTIGFLGTTYFYVLITILPWYDLYTKTKAH